MKIILPFLILGLAAAVFFYFTAPLLDQVDALKIQQAELTVALAHANKLKERQDELAAIYNAIDPADEKNLEEFLPNNIDNVRLIIDINDIAKKYGLTIRNPNIVKEEAKEDKPAPAAGESSAVISFAVSSSYEILKLFLDDLAKSLRIVDLDSLSFTANDRNLYDYQISLRTYWLK
ncbi:MAG: type 4a pilus biogenesis protein PilO [Candidatus Vogelbacteria bacterium]|nr:type 4a pilus biogenesis protein PilO [Candidatus Vogelbacteria bacterium]